MKTRLLLILVVTLTCLAVMVACNTAPSSSPTAMLAASPDGKSPSPAVDIAGGLIQESSVTQPDKPIILGKDSTNPKWGALRDDKAFDHRKHNTDVSHTRDGKTLTACVECHHTEQPSAPAEKPYLKRFERKAVLTAEQLESSKEPVKSCRVCHVQEEKPTAEFPPSGVTYPKEIAKAMAIAAGAPFKKLSNQFAYHIRCISCHDAAMSATNRDPKPNAPQACGDCHVKK